MDTINTILYTLHVLSVLAILVLLLVQWNKNPRKFNPGILHAGLSALIAGLALVGIFESVHPDETLNHTKVGIKLLILIVILIIGYRNVKKPVLSKNTWLALIGLTVTNILIASIW
jgi:peptidoglycan/LPS O-acetylase OafA/YrhL